VKWKNPSELIARLNISPVLVDVGASGGPPEIWQRIGASSIYVGFDPDLREIKTIRDGAFRKSVIVNRAVAGSGANETVGFILTASPYCSSTLEPDAKSLADYFIAPFFDVDRKTTVPATTLDKALDDLGLPAAHWVKIDSQGTDLRIFMGLGSKLRDVLAADLESSLFNMYHDEDMFPETHRQMMENGFWLSDLNVVGAVRMRRKTRVALEARGFGSGAVHASIRTSPGWCEARYLRTIPSLEERHAPLADYALLWTFAMLTGQVGFALDLAIAAAERFGQNEESVALMHRRTTEAMRFGVVSRLWPIVRPLNSLVPGAVKRGIRQILSS
jgi:FkbM family methyltransferase